jgi:iron(III) transport system substrate-binding protein
MSPLRIALLSAAALAITAAASAQEVNVYSARHYDSDLELYADFTAATGIKVNVIEASGAELIERIKAEGENSPADVIITVDAGNLWRVEDAGLFQPVHSAILEERIPANVRHPDGLWFAISKRARVIMYEKALGIPEGLDTYEDLADPAYSGMVCIRSSSNVYNQSLLGSIIAAHGEADATAWAAGLVANLAREPEGGDRDQITGLISGECRIAVSNTYYLGQMLVSSDADTKAIAEQVGIIFPNQEGEGLLGRGAHVNISGVGVVKTAPNYENAVKFLEFLVGDQAQEVIARQNQEFPVVAGVAAPAAVAAFGPFKEDQLNASVFGANNPLALEIADQVGWK